MLTIWEFPISCIDQELAIISDVSWFSSSSGITTVKTTAVAKAQWYEWGIWKDVKGSNLWPTSRKYSAVCL